MKTDNALRVNRTLLDAILHSGEICEETSVVQLALDLRDAHDALWAVRVLDAWRRLTRNRRRWYMSADGCVIELSWGDYTRSFDFADPDAARLAAAEAVFPELPADVRQAWGEKP